MKPFTTDGCSGGMSFLWKLIFRKPTPWEDCCVEHDKKYWQGGTSLERKNADIELYNKVKERGHPVFAFLMYYSVRFGGHPIFPFSWRWGYGESWPKHWFYK